MSFVWDVDSHGFTFWTDNTSTGKLEELFSFGKAQKISDEQYLVLHEDIAALDKTERELLELPEVFPYRLRVLTRGILASKDFRYSIEFMRPDGTAFINPKVIGSFIEINDEQRYTFNLWQFIIVSKVNESNEKLEKCTDDFDVQQYNFSNFADIKEAAENIEAEVDLCIQKNKVVVPKKLSIAPRFQENGDILVDPVLMDENGDALSDSKDFVKVFNARKQVNNLYAGVNGFYLIEPIVKSALTEIKEHRRIKKEDTINFLKNPETVFFSPIFDFNIDDYSDRVIDIGEYKYKSESNGSSGISWLPPEGTLIDIDPETGFVLTLENVEEVDRLIKEAISDNRDFIVFEGHRIPITAKLIADVERLLALLKGGDAPTGTPDPDEPKPDGGDGTSAPHGGGDSGGTNGGNTGGSVPGSKKPRRPILLIADNFANIEYSGNSEREKVIDSIDLTKCLKNGINLLQHQKEGVQWLLNCYANYKGALLADDMGLGKTLQTLAFAAITKKYLPEAFAKSILIVAPVSLLMNWKEEYEKFVAPGLFKEVVVIGSNNVNYFHRNGTFDFSAVSEDRIVLTSYETLRTYQFSLGKIDWSLMVLDEAQRIKNPTALITLAIKAMKYDFGLCLTGTPIENTWIDLWSIMDFAAPGYNLGSLSEFKKNYVNKLKKHSKDEAYIKQLGQSLNNELKPLFKRRLKKTLSEKGGLQELPKKKIIKRKEIMPLTQRLAYENIVNEALGNSVDKKTALEVIAKLRDISLFPDIGTIDERSLSHKDAVRIFNSSARLKVAFTELVNIAAKDEKVLIFIESKKMQRILRSVIETFFKIKVPTPINGDMRSEIRQAIVDNFNLHEGFGVLILSPLAAGVGLNIATANHVIHLSRHWNPAKEDQATDRAYRIGQKKDVEVVIPMAVHPTLKEGSFDSMLDTLLDYKRQLSEEALFPTADSADDGLNIFREIAKGGSGATTITKEYYDIDSVDGVDGITFEKITANLYNNIGMLANKTTDSNDNGADVVAFSGSDKPNLLIQCKKTKNYEDNMGKDGIQEIAAALSYYERMHSCKFEPVVITNAKDFTSGAKDLARANGVQLICRTKLIEMLANYPVEKIYV